MSFSQCPEMDIQGNFISIVSGDDTPETLDGTYFGQVNFGNFIDQSFSIINTGPVNLNLNGLPLVSITGSVDFTIVTDPGPVILANGGTTMFTVRYSPSMAGTINTATLSISNDDCDENPYIFDVQGQSSTLSIEETKIDDRFHFYPNPSKGYINIEIPAHEELISFSIYSIEGKRIEINYFERIQNNGKTKIHLNKGIYFASLITTTSKLFKKLIIQ